MSIVNIRTTKSIHSALSYQEKNDRAVYETSSCKPMSFYDTAMSMLSKHKRRKIEGLTIVQSFSPAELDCKNPNDVLRAHQAGIALCSLLSEKYHVMYNVVTHVDSKGGNIHSHIVIPNVDLQTGKALQGKIKLFTNLSSINDDLMRDLGLEVCNEPKDGYDFRRDFINRLHASINQSHTYDEFIIEATKRGISVQDRKSNGQFLKHITYEFLDPTGTKHKMRDNKIDTKSKDDPTKITYNQDYIQNMQRKNLQQQYANLPQLDLSLMPHKSKQKEKQLSL